MNHKLIIHLSIYFCSYFLQDQFLFYLSEKKKKIETTGRITHIQSLVANQQRLNKYIKNQITKILLVCRQKFEFFIYILIRLY